MKKRNLKKAIVTAAAAMFSLCPGVAQAQEVVMLGSFNLYACYLQDFDGFWGGDIYSLDQSLGLNKRFANKRKLKRERRKMKRQRRRAARRGEDVAYYDMHLADLKVARANFNPCWNGDLGSGGSGDTGGGGGDTGGGDTGGGGGGTGGGTGGGDNSAPACSVATGNFSAASQLSARIINGTKCSITSNTPTVLLEIDGSAGCTGTVIGSRAVLTASHCTETASTMAVVIGSRRVAVTNIHTHPGYSQSNTPFAKQDIAVVTVGEDLNITPAKVVMTTDFTVGEAAIVAGYGLVRPAEDFTDGLQAVHVYLSSSDDEQVTSTYSQQPGYGSNCNGDSGGPLYVKRGGEWAVAAVVSNGDDNLCGSTGNTDNANYTLTGNNTNEAFILQLVSDVQFVE